MIDTDSDSDSDTDTDIMGLRQEYLHHLIGFAPMQALSYNTVDRLLLLVIICRNKSYLYL
jgi:hypothetical protein